MAADSTGRAPDGGTIASMLHPFRPRVHGPGLHRLRYANASYYARATMRLPRIEATRYVTPLREGGSLPALVEASDDGLYVLKFRGAGQGAKALVAEIVAGELAR